MAIHDGNRASDTPTTTEKTHPVGFELWIAYDLALNHGVMRSPDFRLAGATAPRCQDRAQLGDIFGLHKEF